jgi:hypothetical protein
MLISREKSKDSVQPDDATAQPDVHPAACNDHECLSGGTEMDEPTVASDPKAGDVSGRASPYAQGL